MKKFAYLVISVLSATLFLSSCNSKDTETNLTDDVITVGVLAPLTGSGAVYGDVTSEGVNLAVEEINEAAGKTVFRVVYEDDRMTAKDGVNAFQRLNSQVDPSVVIGPFGSSVVLAVAPLANQSETVIISASATADSIADAGDFVFRITPPNSKQGADIAEFAYDNLSKKYAAVVFQRNDYGQTLRDAFVQKFEAKGGKVVAVEGVPSETTDFRPVVTKIKALNPDIVFFPVHSQEGTILLRQASDLGLDVDFISADGAMTTELIEGAGEASEGVYFSTLGLGYGQADEDIASFQSAFSSKYGKSADAYAPYYYDVTKLVYTAVSDVGDDPIAVRDYLYSLNGGNSFNGITGPTRFDANGEVDKSFYMFQVRGGKFKRHDE